MESLVGERGSRRMLFRGTGSPLRRSAFQELRSGASKGFSRSQFLERLSRQLANLVDFDVKVARDKIPFLVHFTLVILS
jgi:hypothetical protein